jgi:hypothetical protein
MANEQTSVPLYAAAEVLTAANMNISAGTGVPVFATTVTRDAAFGGAGEKVLAEGQLCYLSASNIVQQYNGSSWETVGPASSGVVQVKSTTVTASTFNTSSSSLVDITGLSVSITPTSASNKILVTAFVSGDTSTNTEITVLQLARGGTSIGVGTGGGSIVGTNVGETRSTDRAYSFAMQFLDSPATTSATTYNVRTRTANGAYSFYLNRRAATDEYNGISTITVMEVTP